MSDPTDNHPLTMGRAQKLLVAVQAALSAAENIPRRDWELLPFSVETIIYDLNECRKAITQRYNRLEVERLKQGQRLLELPYWTGNDRS